MLVGLQAQVVKPWEQRVKGYGCGVRPPAKLESRTEFPFQSRSLFQRRRNAKQRGVPHSTWSKPSSR